MTLLNSKHQSSLNASVYELLVLMKTTEFTLLPSPALLLPLPPSLPSLSPLPVPLPPYPSPLSPLSSGEVLCATGVHIPVLSLPRPTPPVVPLPLQLASLRSHLCYHHHYHLPHDQGQCPLRQCQDAVLGCCGLHKGPSKFSCAGFEKERTVCHIRQPHFPGEIWNGDGTKPGMGTVPSLVWGAIAQHDTRDCSDPTQRDLPPPLPPHP